MKYVIESINDNDMATVYLGEKYEVKREGDKLIFTSAYNDKILKPIAKEEKKDFKSFLPDVWTGDKDLNMRSLPLNFEPIYLHKNNKDIRIERKGIRDNRVLYKYYAPCPNCGDNTQCKKKSSIHSNGKQRYKCNKCGFVGIGRTFGLPNNEDDIKKAMKFGNIDEFVGDMK